MANDGKAEVECFEIDNPGQKVVVVMPRRACHGGAHGSILRAKIQRVVDLEGREANRCRIVFAKRYEEREARAVVEISVVLADQRRNRGIAETRVGILDRFRRTTNRAKRAQRTVGIGHGQNNSPGSAEDLYLTEMGSIEFVKTNQG